MEKLVVVRHGHYFGSSDMLSDDGKEQMRCMGSRLAQITVGKKTTVLSSIAARAAESADIIVGVLGGGNYETHEVLWSQNSHPENLPAAAELVGRYATSEVLILVTHKEYAEKFPTYYVEKVLGGCIFGSIPSKIDNGQGVLIDCEAKLAILVLSN